MKKEQFNPSFLPFANPASIEAAVDDGILQESDRPLGNKSASWLLKNRRQIIEQLTVYLAMRMGEEYSDDVKWHELDPTEAYRACCLLLESGFDVAEWLRKEESTYWGDADIDAEPERKPLSETEIFEIVMRYIIVRKIDITASRRDWLVIGSVLKSTFGNDGIEWFLALSQFYEGFTESETRRQYKSLRASGFGLGAFYNVCKRHGILVKDVLMVCGYGR